MRKEFSDVDEEAFEKGFWVAHRGNEIPEWLSPHTEITIMIAGSSLSLQPNSVEAQGVFWDDLNGLSANIVAFRKAE